MTEHLYKFRSLAASETKWAQRIFTHNELYLASRVTFNDPYDCCPAMRYDGPSKKIIANFNRYNRQQRSLGNRAARRAEQHRRTQNLKRNLRDPARFAGAREGLFAQIQRDLDGVGILSLSGRADHVLMWSHYADQHKGICVRLKEQGSLHDAHHVRYSNERLLLDFLHYEPEALVDALLTKGDFWEYEAERRIIDLRGPGPRIYDPALLDAVIFGANISAQNEAMVRAWVAERPTIELLRARLNASRYVMDIVPA